MQLIIGEKDKWIEELEKVLCQIQRGNNDSDLSLDSKSSDSQFQSKDIKSSSSIEFSNTCKNHEVIEDNNKKEDAFIDNKPVPNSSPIEKRINSVKVIDPPTP